MSQQVQQQQPPTLSFGKDLWDNMIAIESYTQEGVDQLNRALEYFKRRCQIELQYSRDLQKLSEQYRDLSSSGTGSTNTIIKKKKMSTLQGSSGGGTAAATVGQQPLQLAQGNTLVRAIEVLYEQSDQVAKAHYALSQFMDMELVNSLLKNSTKSFDMERKQKLNDVAARKNELKRYFDNLDKAKKAYESACKIAEDARVVAEKARTDMNVTKANEEKAKDDAHTKSKRAEEADEEYQKFLAMANDKQIKHYQEELPTAINAIQKMEELRVDHMKQVLVKYASSTLQYLPDITSAYQKIFEVASTISKSDDSLLFIKQNRLNATMPPPIPYENYWEKYASKSQKKILVLKGAEDDDKLESIAPEKAYKKALARLKELDKEISELEDKKSGIELLADAYEATPELADPKALVDLGLQLDDLEQKIDIAKLKKFKYEGFVTKHEKKEQPKMPVLYADTKEGALAAQLRALVLGEKAVQFNKSSLSLADSSKQAPMSSSDFDLNNADSVSADAKKFIALYDFPTSGNPNELGISKGDIIYVSDQPSEKGWVKARDASGRIGYVPSTYIAEHSG